MTPNANAQTLKTAISASGRPTTWTQAVVSWWSPFDFADAGRTAVFTDEEGAAFCVWEANQHNGAQVVNDPGSLNFNGLNTRDTEAAKAFNGSVFGWRTFAMGEAEMWALDGYGDFIESHRFRPPRTVGGGRCAARVRGRGGHHQPNRRHPARHAGALERELAVEDVNTAAAKATELGGAVLVPPFNAPWSGRRSSTTRRARPSPRAGSRRRQGSRRLADRPVTALPPCATSRSDRAPVGAPATRPSRFRGAPGRRCPSTVKGGSAAAVRFDSPDRRGAT